jgi:hypothetical protein
MSHITDFIRCAEGSLALTALFCLGMFAWASHYSL